MKITQSFFMKKNKYILFKNMLILLSPICFGKDTMNSLIETYDYSDLKINIVIKDNIDIKNKTTSAGSLALKNNKPKDNAFLIDMLLKNGFHISGKANLSEWANFRSTKSVSGWSSYGGQTYHFLDNEYNPCGSSSGSAVAVASGLVDIAIGTETNGSISCPASINGIVGMKPTVGLVSRSGIVPISKTQDTAGPMGINVNIVALTLQSIAGADQKDSATLKIPTNFDFNFMDNLNTASFVGKRLGFLKTNNQSSIVKKLEEELISVIKKAGGIIVFFEDSRIYPASEEYFLLKYEFKHGLEEYLANSNSEYKTLIELIEFNEINKEIVMQHFGQEIFYESIDAAKNKKKYLSSLKKIKKVRLETIAILKDNNLDAFIGLTRGPAWKINYSGGDSKEMQNSLSFGNGGYAAFSGLPHITVPFFKINNYPVGVSFIGLPWTDELVLGLGAALEKEQASFLNLSLQTGN